MPNPKLSNLNPKDISPERVEALRRRRWLKAKSRAKTKEEAIEEIEEQLAIGEELLEEEELCHSQTE